MIANAEGGSRKVIVDADLVYPTFDAFPKYIREAIAAAPYEYDVRGIYEDYTQATRDPFFGVSGYEYLRIMESNFRADVVRDTFTGVERSGAYKLVRRIHGQPKQAGPNLRRQSRNRARRQCPVFGAGKGRSR